MQSCKLYVYLSTFSNDRKSTLMLFSRIHSLLEYLSALCQVPLSLTVVQTSFLSTKVLLLAATHLHASNIQSRYPSDSNLDGILIHLSTGLRVLYATAPLRMKVLLFHSLPIPELSSRQLYRVTLPSSDALQAADTFLLFPAPPHASRADLLAQAKLYAS